MGRRTLVGHELQFHEKYTRNPERYEPSNLLGRNLMDIFLEWCNSVEKSTLLSTDTNIWLAINDIYSVSPQIALLKLAIGKWGEDGVLLDNKNSRKPSTDCGNTSGITRSTARIHRIPFFRRL